MILQLTIVVSAVAILAVADPVSAQRSSAGRARIQLTGTDVSVDGEFPTTICGGPYMLGKGLAYQTKAGDWQITVAAEERTSGLVPLNEADRSVNVVVTLNAPGKNSVRGPANGGSLRVSPDFKKAEATLDVRSLLGRQTAKLVATFTCQ